MNARIPFFAVLLLGTVLSACDGADPDPPEQPPFPLPLAAPSGVRVSEATPTSVTLRWTDPNKVETGYEVRSGCVEDCPEYLPTVLATLAPNAQAFTVEGLVGTAPQRFQIVAIGDGEQGPPDATIRIEYPSSRSFSLPTSKRAYLSRDGSLVFQYAETPRGILALESKTGASRTIGNPPSDSRDFDHIVTASDDVVIVYNSGDEGGEADTAGILSSQGYGGKRFENPGGKILLDQPGIEGIMVSPPNLRLLLGSYASPNGPRIAAWVARGDYELTSLLDEYQHMAVVGLTSTIGTLVLMNRGTGMLHGYYIGNGLPIEPTWSVATGWADEADWIPQLAPGPAQVAFERDGAFYIHDALSGEMDLNVPTERLGNGRIVALTNGHLVIQSDSSLYVLEVRTNRVIRRFDVTLALEDGWFGIEGKHVVTIEDGELIAIVTSDMPGGHPLLYRRALEGVWASDEE